MSDAQSQIVQWGPAWVTVIEPAGVFIDTAPAVDPNSAAESDLWLAEVITSFRLVMAEGEPGGSASITIALDGEPELLVAVVFADEGTFAHTAESDGAGRCVFTIGAVPLGAVIDVLELPSRREAEAYLEWIKWRPGRSTRSDDMIDLETPGRGDDAIEGWRAEEDRAAAAPPEADGAEAPEQTRVLAHALAEMPRSCRVGEVAVVTFSLSWLKLTPSTGVEFDVAEFPIDPDLPVRVSIATRGYRLVKNGHRTRTLSLKSAVKDVVRFKVEAVTTGRAEVTLVVRQRHELPLATLRLTSEIVTSGAVAEGVARGSADALPPDPTVTALPTLRIDESLADGVSRLDIAVQIGVASASGSTVTVDKPGLIAEVYEKISALRTHLKAMKEAGDSAEDRKLVGLERLRERGVDLSIRLFPPHVRQFMWENLSQLDNLIIQTTGEFDIPWEIIYVSDPHRSVSTEPEVGLHQFLGMRGATRWVYNAAMPRNVTIGPGRAKYLCPIYTGPGLSLNFTRREGQLVRKAFGARVVRPGNADAVSKVITGGFDFLHFGGHGVWTDTPPEQRLLFAAYRKDRPAPDGASYSATRLRHDLPDKSITDPSAPAPMVFLNACDVGRLDTSATGLGGFPEAFLRGGVGVLLGCSWAVDDEIAGEFSERFYDVLAVSDIAGAMKEARTEALAKADLSALAYVAYAHPHARVTVA